nr:endonuclease/exonuclease/phosphatase family protein [Rubellimicrobium mesophilum]
MKGDDPGIEGVAAVLAEARPDVLLLTDLDWDADGIALSALAERLAREGLGYPYRLALPTNAGAATGLDLDGNGRTGEARDAQGFGRFAGDGGMALLSRWPLGEARDLSTLLWRDLPGSRQPGAFPSEEAAAARRLSSDGHWIVPVEAPGGAVTLLAWDATTPVFDGPEDLNGLRNADELALWRRVLDGAFGPAPRDFVLLGNADLDPADGEGLRADMAALLADPRVQDPRPLSEGGRLAASPGQAGDPALDTADWPEEDGPGNLRVDYVLPAATLRVTGAGVVWPAPGDPLASAAEAAGPHRLVWVDLDR